MEKSIEAKLASKQLQENKEKHQEENRFTDKERKNKEAKRKSLGGF